MTVTEMIGDGRRIPPKKYAKFYSLQPSSIHRNRKEGFIQAASQGTLFFRPPS